MMLGSDFDAVGEDVVVFTHVALVVADIVKVDGVNEVFARTVLEDKEEVDGEYEPPILPSLEELAPFEEIALSDEVSGELALEESRIHQQNIYLL